MVLGPVVRGTAGPRTTCPGTILGGDNLSCDTRTKHFTLGVYTGTGDKSENMSNTGIGLGLRIGARARS